jgi:hypothetical protein
MERVGADRIRAAVGAAQEIARTGNFDRCDAGDLEEVIEAIERELEQKRPSEQTLATYLNSLARSLRSDARSRNVCKQLDAAMRDAGLPTSWER